MRYLIAGFIIYTLYFMICYINTGTDKKNLKSYFSYPDIIQKKILGNSDLKILIPKKKNYIQTFISNFVPFFVVFVLTGFVLQCFDFKSAFILLLIMGEGLNLFDFLIIDCCWFVRAKRTRLKNIGTPEMYLGYRKHFISFLKAIPVFAAAAFAGAIVLSFFKM